MDCYVSAGQPLPNMEKYFQKIKKNSHLLFRMQGILTPHPLDNRPHHLGSGLLLLLCLISLLFELNTQVFKKT